MKIIEITEQGNDKTFKVCLADKCKAGEEHAAEHHRSWTWGKCDMTEEQMIAEVKLLAKDEKQRLDTPPATVRPVSIKV